MTTVINNTNRGVIIYNQIFCEDISPKNSFKIASEHLINSNTIKIRWASSKQNDNWSFDVEKSFTGRLRPYLYNETRVCLISSISISDNMTIILQKDEICLPSLALFFKRVYIMRIKCQVSNTEYKSNMHFIDGNDKKKLKKLTLIELLFTLPITFVLLITLFPILLDNCELGIKITDIILTLLFTYLTCVNAYYLIFISKLQIDD